MIVSILTSWLIAFGTLFALANPIEALPVFLELTGPHTPEQRARQSRRACLYAGILMAVSLLLGNVLLRIFGASPDAVLTAGGLVVLALGFPMLMTGRVKFDAEQVADKTKDFALIPLAFPGVCGPGAMAALISGASYIQNLPDPQQRIRGYAVVLAAIVSVCFAAWLILRYSAAIARWLGPTGMNALVRFMGLLLIIIAVQFLADGITGMVKSAPQRMQDKERAGVVAPAEPVKDGK